jgi:hypothetical protein
MLIVNKLISYNTENNQKIVERLLWLNKEQEIGFFINLYSNQLPYAKNITEIEIGINENKILVESQDPFGRIVNEEDIPENHLTIRDKAWEVIKDIVVLEPLIYDSSERRKLVLKVCEKFNIHESTVMRYLKKYWQRGKTKNALLPDYYMCGGKGKEKEVGELKRGRPRKNAEILGDGINIDEETKRIFRIAINKYYYNASKKSLKLTYELMLRDYFSKENRIENGIKMPIVNSIEEIPTFGQFRYWFEKDRNYKKEITTRYSAKTYELKHRPIIGQSTCEAMGPGSIFQIDATIADIYLLSRFNRNWIIGRPTIFAVMDVFSRMIVGLYVGLENNSWIGAMMALANAASNKVDFYKEYGIEIDEQDFPVAFLPESIIADRGELEGYNIEQLVNAFHIKIQNTPPYRADWKGIIEQNFRITNLRTKSLLPGVINSEVRQRGEKDYRLDAKLDIYQFTQIILKCALYHNNYHYLTNYSREEMMIEDDVEPVPIKLWNWGIANRSGKLRYVPEDIVKLNLMPTGTATVTSQGIKFNGMLYGSKQSLKEKWFEKARNRDTWKVSVSYDPRKMDYIYIRDDKGLSYEKCFLLEHQQRYKDKTLDEINYLLEYERQQEKKYSGNKIQAKIDLISEIENIVKQAEQQTFEEQTNVGSKKSRLKNIRKNRKVEKMLQREKEAFELDQRDTVEDTEVIPFNKNDSEENNADSVFNLLLRKQKEALKKIHGK